MGFMPVWVVVENEMDWALALWSLSGRMSGRVEGSASVRNKVTKDKKSRRDGLLEQFQAIKWKLRIEEWVLSRWRSRHAMQSLLKMHSAAR